MTTATSASTFADLAREFKQTSPDFMYTKRFGRMYLNVHLSSSDANLHHNQITQLTQIINAVRDEGLADSVTLVGDWNAEFRPATQDDCPFDKQSIVHIFDKDIHSLRRSTILAPEARIATTNLGFCTTKKKRCLTVQFPKIDRESGSESDGGMVVVFDPEAPLPDLSTTQCRTGNVVMNPCTRICPLSWLSDHASVDFFDGRATVVTLNVGGESGAGMNFFEFYTPEIHDLFFQTDEGTALRTRMADIQHGFFSRYPFFTELAKGKTISTALRNCDIFNIHWSERFGDPDSDVAAAYTQAREQYDRNTMGDSTQYDKRFARLVGDMILELWDRYYADDLLGPVFKRWYWDAMSARINRPDLLSEVDRTLARYAGPVVIALQEVSKGQLTMLEEYAQCMANITIECHQGTEKQKTRGVFVVRYA